MPCFTTTTITTTTTPLPPLLDSFSQKATENIRLELPKSKFTIYQNLLNSSNFEF